LKTLILLVAGLSGREVWGVGLRPLACWDCGFEYRWGMGVSLSYECCVLSGRDPCDEL